MHFGVVFGESYDKQSTRTDVHSCELVTLIIIKTNVNH